MKERRKSTSLVPGRFHVAFNERKNNFNVFIKGSVRAGASQCWQDRGQESRSLLMRENFLQNSANIGEGKKSLLSPVA